MDRQVFDDICDAIIRPLGDDMAERTFNIPDGDYVLTFAGEWDSVLYEHYERWRIHAHSIMRDEGMLIDRHKVVACLILAVLEAEPLLRMQFSSDEHVRLPKIGILCNEYLAFQVGMQVLRGFTLADALEDGDQDLGESLVEPMCYPRSTVDGESYLDQMYRALYHLRLQLQKQRSDTGWHPAESQQRNNRFSADQFLLLANLVFMLEQYNLYVKTHGPE